VSLDGQYQFGKDGTHSTAMPGSEESVPLALPAVPEVREHNADWQKLSPIDAVGHPAVDTTGIRDAGLAFIKFMFLGK